MKKILCCLLAALSIICLPCSINAEEIEIDPDYIPYEECSITENGEEHCKYKTEYTQKRLELLNAPVLFAEGSGSYKISGYYNRYSSTLDKEYETSFSKTSVALGTSYDLFTHYYYKVLVGFDESIDFSKNEDITLHLKAKFVETNSSSVSSIMTSSPTVKVEIYDSTSDTAYIKTVSSSDVTISGGYYTIDTVYSNAEIDGNLVCIYLEWSNIHNKYSTDKYTLSVTLEEYTVTTPDPNAGILEGLGSILDFLVTLPEKIKNALTSLFTDLGNAISNALNVVQQALETALNAVKESVTQIGQNITNALTELGNFIINGLKSLFIPEDDYFQAYFDELTSFFSEKLGILSLPFEVFISFINAFLGIGDNYTAIVIPEIKINDWVIYEGGEALDFKAIFETGEIATLYNIYLIFVDAFIYLALLNYARKMWDEFIGGHTS